MGRLERYRAVVRGVLQEYTRVQYAYGDIHNEAVFDLDNDRYLVVSTGWQGPKRIHGCLIHIDIKDGKVWIQRDGTEHGIARDLEAGGVPKEDIVLAFHPPSVRPHTGYAVA